MNVESTEEEKKTENQNNQEILNEILVKRSKQQRKSWFGQDKEKDKEKDFSKSYTFENAEPILEEEIPTEKK